MKIKKGDNIIVISGKDKGKTGTVFKAMPKTSQVIIEGVNVVTRHQKNRRTRSQGQIIEKSAPIHVSNIAIAVDGKAVRVGYTTETDEKKGAKKIRVARPSGKKI